MKVLILSDFFLVLEFVLEFICLFDGNTNDCFKIFSIEVKYLTKTYFGKNLTINKEITLR